MAGIIQENDALGGAGSLGRGLQVLAVNGLARIIDGSLSKKYPLTSFNEKVAVNTAGEVRPAGAPAKDTSAAAAAFDALKNPVVIAVGVSVVASLLLFFVLRR